MVRRSCSLTGAGTACDNNGVMTHEIPVRKHIIINASRCEKEFVVGGFCFGDCDTWHLAWVKV